MAQFVEYPYRWSWRNYLGGNTYTTVYSAFPAVAYTGPPYRYARSTALSCYTHMVMRPSDIEYFLQPSTRRFHFREMLACQDPLLHNDEGPAILSSRCIAFHAADYGHEPVLQMNFYLHGALHFSTPTQSVMPFESPYTADADDLMLEWKCVVHLADGRTVPADEYFALDSVSTYNPYYSGLAWNVPQAEWTRNGSADHAWEQGGLALTAKKGTTEEQVPDWMTGTQENIRGVSITGSYYTIPTEAQASGTATITDIAPYEEGNRWGMRLTLAEDVVAGTIPVDPMTGGWYVRALTGPRRGRLRRIIGATDGGEGSDTIDVGYFECGSFDIGDELFYFQVPDDGITSDRERLHIFLTDVDQSGRPGNTRVTINNAPESVVERTAANVLAYGIRIRNLQAVAEVIPAGTDAPVTMPVSQSFFADEET